MITIDEVNKFLDEFKVKAKVFGIIYRDERRKNIDTLFQLGISARGRTAYAVSFQKGGVSYEKSFF